MLPMWASTKTTEDSEKAELKDCRCLITDTCWILMFRLTNPFWQPFMQGRVEDYFAELARLPEQTVVTDRQGEEMAMAALFPIMNRRFAQCRDGNGTLMFVGNGASGGGAATSGTAAAGGGGLKDMDIDMDVDSPCSPQGSDLSDLFEPPTPSKSLFDGLSGGRSSGKKSSGKKGKGNEESVEKDTSSSKLDSRPPAKPINSKTQQLLQRL